MEPGRQGRDGRASPPSSRRSPTRSLRRSSRSRVTWSCPSRQRARSRARRSSMYLNQLRHRHAARGGRDDQRLRPGHRARRGRLPVQDRRGRGVLLRPDRGGARDQPVRHAPEVRRRDQPGQRHQLPADRLDEAETEAANESEMPSACSRGSLARQKRPGSSGRRSFPGRAGRLLPGADRSARPRAAGLGDGGHGTAHAWPPRHCRTGSPLTIRTARSRASRSA